MKHMEYKNRVKVYEEAIEHFGVEPQAVVAIEEMTECAKELCKVLRRKGDRNHLAEEVADATIMLEQMRLAFGINDAVKYWMDAKVLRLQEDITKQKGKKLMHPPKHPVLDCENCSHYSRSEEMCTHPEGNFSGECIWKEE